MIRYKLFMDPVYDEFIMIEKDGVLSNIVNSPIMQRLRYIRQLGPCYYVYPGAEHTRFQHSLGVLWLVKKAITFLEEKGFSIDEELKESICIAALVHDLGHSPFSHALEGEIIPLSHEELSVKAVEKLESEGVIDEAQKREVVSIISKSHSYPFSYQLISSQLDCDRLDYLRRDAFYTGVSYGKVDVNRILVSILLENGNVVWDYRGFNALESYVMSRYQMYWTVYFHKINISAQVILRKIMKRLKDLIIRENRDFPVDPFLKSALNGDVEKFFLITDANVIATIYRMVNSEDNILSDLCCRFIGRKFFRVIEIEDPQVVLRAKEGLERLGMDPDYYMATVEPAKVAYSYYSPSGVDVILVNFDGRLEEISNIAPTDALKSLSRKVKKNLLVVPNEVNL